MKYIKLITPRLAAGTLRNGDSQGEQANAPLESPSARIYFAQAKYNQGKNTPGLAPGIFILSLVLFLFSSFVLAQPVVQTNSAPPVQQLSVDKKAKPAVPTPQTSSTQLAADAHVQKLQQEIADLRSLITIQGRQINALMLQQKHLYDDLNNKISMLKASVGSLQAVSSVQPKPATPPVDQQEVAAYQSAYQLMRNRNYSQAIKSFNNYLQKYPKGSSVVDAYYWLGELYAVAGNNDQAIQQLTLIVNQYPNSTKTPQAMLKLGSLANDQKQFAQAKSWWQKLVDKFPKSTAARIAKTQLQQLQQLGQ